MNLRLQHSALSRTESSDGHCCQSVAAARLNVCSSVAAVVAVWLEMYGVEACNANFWGRNCSSSEVTQQMCAFIIIFMVGVFPNDVRFHSTLHYGKKPVLPTFFHWPNQFPWCTVTWREFSPNLQIHSIITSQDWRIWNFNGRHLYYKITLNNNEVWNLRNVIDKYFQVRHLTNIRGRVSREENRTKWLRDVSWLRWWRRSPALVGICPLGRGWDPTRVKLADVPTIPYHTIPYHAIPYPGPDGYPRVLDYSTF